MRHEGPGIGNNQRNAVPEGRADGIADFRILGCELPDQERSLIAIKPLKAFGQTYNAIGGRQRTLPTRARKCLAPACPASQIVQCTSIVPPKKRGVKEKLVRRNMQWRVFPGDRYGPKSRPGPA